MARARKRTSESVEDSKLLRERRGRPRSRGRAHRRLADPVDFLRRVRYFAQYVNGTWDQTAWEDEKTDLLLRCAAIDPCLESMSPAEATAGESRRDQDTATVVAGVSHLPVTAIEDLRARATKRSPVTGRPPTTNPASMRGYARRCWIVRPSG